MSLGDARSLLLHTMTLLAPLFEASDRALQALSGQGHLDAWDFSYWNTRLTTRDHTGRLDHFLNTKDALETAIHRLGHEDLYAKLTVIVSDKRYAIVRCVAVSPPHEVVVIVHEPARDDTHELSTQFHEVGHGLHFAGMSEDMAYIERVMVSPWNEAMAFLCEDLMLEPGVLVAEENRDALDEVLALQMASRLFFVRVILRNLALNAVLYGNEQWPLDALTEKISAIQRRFFPLRKNNHPLWWANNTHIVEYPFYDINYLYGYMIAAQIRAWWKRTHDEPILSKAFGDLLREKCYQPGSSVPWRELLRDITGEELNPQYLVEELSIAFPSKA